MLMNSFSDRLKEERERLGFNQEAFGAIGGVKRLAQGNYEKGDRAPDLNYLAAVAKVGVDVLYVVTGARSQQSLTPTEQLFLEKYRASEQALQDRALRVLLGEQQITTKFNVQGDVGGQVDSISGGTFKIDMRGDKK